MLYFVFAKTNINFFNQSLMDSEKRWTTTLFYIILLTYL